MNFDPPFFYAGFLIGLAIGVLISASVSQRGLVHLLRVKAESGMRLALGGRLYWIREDDATFGFKRAAVDPPGFPVFVDPLAVLAAKALQPPGIPREAVEIRKTIPDR